MSTPARAKPALRDRLLAARRAVPRAVREAEAQALARALAASLANAPAGAVRPRVRSAACAYWPVGSEPGSPALLTVLLDLGWRVLLPVSTPTGPLNWAEYSGTESLRAGPVGVREPTGPMLGCAAVAEAVLVLVPALAVDRRGVRLGRGGGHYDRTLPLATPGTPLIAVVRDDEVLDSLPAEPHDVLVSAALTPGAGLLPLPRSRPAHRLD